MLLAVVKSEQPNSCCLSMSKLAASLNHSDVSPPFPSFASEASADKETKILLFQVVNLVCSVPCHKTSVDYQSDQLSTSHDNKRKRSPGDLSASPASQVS